jgi:two-component system nitrate/nitrite response regulator NarL
LDDGAEDAASTVKRLARARKQRRAVPIVIVDKSALFRAGLTSILAGSRFRVAASCANIDELGKKIVIEKPNIALITLDKEAEIILAQAAALTDQGLRVLMLSERFRPEEVFAAIEAGADGYLLKNEISPDALLKSLELVCLGGVVIPHGFAKLLKNSAQPETPAAIELPERVPPAYQEPAPSPCPPTDDFGRLSNRERMILTHLTQGASNKQIARELNIAEATVKVHVKSLLRKIRVNNRTQAAMWAMGNLHK